MRLTIAVVLICVIASACQFSEGLHQTVARADETVVITTLRSISTAQNAYALSNGGNYGTFAQLVAGGFLDPRFDSGKPPVKDYSLAMVVTEVRVSERRLFLRQRRSTARRRRTSLLHRFHF